MALSTQSRSYDFDAGVRHLKARQFGDALAQFKGIAADNPDHVMAHFQAGRALLEMMQAGEAVSWFEKAAALSPETPQVWQGWAEAVALGGGDADRKAFLAALKDAPINPDLRLQLQDRFGALRAGSRPKSGGVPKSEIKPLLSLLAGGQFQKVEATARGLLATYPKSAVLAFLLAKAQAGLGRNREAFDQYQKAIKLDPLYAEAYAAAGQLLAAAGQELNAVNAFRPAVILAPDMVPALGGLAQGLILANNFRAAIALLERAIRLAPKDGLVRTSLGDAWKRKGDYEAAVAIYDEAVSLYATKDVPAALRLTLADCLAQSYQDDKALAEIDTVLAAAPDHTDALVQKASLLQDKGDFEAAEEVFRQALRGDPLNGHAYRRLVTGYKVQPGDPVIEEMIGVYANSALSDDARMNLGFAIGKALEDSRDDGKVFAYLNDANGLAAKLSEASRRQLFDEIVKCREVFGGIDFAKVPEAGENTLQPIFVTGLPRSGTTLVERIIAAHSSVRGGGELGFAKPLCNDFLNAIPGEPGAANDPRAIAELGKSYTQRIARRFPGVSCLTDKSIYTFLALGPLSRALPQAKFVVVRRDPRDNLLSIYKNKFGDGTHGFANDLVALARYYDEFDKTIAFWREHLPGAFYEVSYDALVANPEAEAPKLIAACGLDWEDDCLNFHQKKSDVKTLSVYQVRQPINTGSLSGWRRFEKDLAPMIEQLKKDGHVTD